MPKIPEFRTNQTIDATPRVANMPKPNQGANKALSDIGNTISQVGAHMLDIEEKRKWAEITTFGDLQSRDFELSMKAAAIEEKGKFADSDFSGYSQRMQEIADKKMDKMSEMAGDTEKSNYFRKKAGIYAADFKMDAMHTENVERAKWGVKKRLEVVEKDASIFLSDPNPIAASERLNVLEQENNAQTDIQFSGTSVKALNESTRKEFRKTVISGLDGEGLLKLIPLNMDRKAKEDFIDKFVSGGVGGTEKLFEGTSNEEKITYKTKLLAALDREERVQIREVASEAKNAISLLGGVGFMKMSDENYITQVTAKINTLPAGPERDELSASLGGAAQARQVLETARVGGPKTLMSTLQDIDTLFPIRPETAAKDTAARSHFMVAVQKEYNESMSDPTKYVNSRWPEVRGNVEKTIAKQLELGLPASVFSKAEAALNASAILEGINPRDRANGFSSVIARVPRVHQQQAVAEMMKADSRIGMEYLIAASTSDIQVQERLISNGAQEKSIKENFSNAIPEGESALKTTLNKSSSLSSMQSTLARSGQDQMSALIRKQVAIEAMRLAPELGMDEAGDKAVELVIDRNFHVIDEPAARIIAPRGAVSSPVLNGFLNQSLEPSNIARYKPSKSAHSFNATDDEWHQYLGERAYWSSNGALDGLTLVIEGSKGPFAVKDSEGKEISIKFSDMEAKTDHRINTNISGGKGNVRGYTRPQNLYKGGFVP